MSKGESQAQKQNPLFHLTAGGCAGFVESSICHPLDTIKTRMQLQINHTSTETHQAAVGKIRPSLLKPALHLRQQPQISEAAVVGLRPVTAAYTTAVARVPAALPMPLGPLGTARFIVHNEGFFALYKGLTAVQTGVIQKMAVRYTSFEQYRDFLDHHAGNRMSPSGINFVAGLGAGLTEAAFITPTEVCKIRMMVGQPSSNISILQGQATTQVRRKYTNLIQTAVTIVREEGVSALYKGVAPTMMRNGTNQAVNFTAYNAAKKKVMELQGTTYLEPWQPLVIGGITGGMGPAVTNPLDVVKTRMQKQVITPGSTPKYHGVFQSMMVITKEEGFFTLWKGLTPRLMRMMPGQAITFMTYEAVSKQMIRFGIFQNQS